MRSLLSTIGRALRWHRRLVAAACAAIAVYAILTVLTTREGDTVVVAAAHGIPGGQVLAATDLTTLRLPSSAVPDGVVTAMAEAVGRAVVAPLPARGVLTASDLVSGGAIVEAGRVALPVTFGSTAPTELLRVGDRIDLLGSGAAGEPGVILGDIRVAALPDARAGGLFGGSGAQVVLLDLTPAEAAKVTASAGSGSLAFALR